MSPSNEFREPYFPLFRQVHRFDLRALHHQIRRTEFGNFECAFHHLHDVGRDELIILSLL